MSDYSDLSSIDGSSHTKISYIETSARTGERIQDAFNLISYHFILKCEEKERTILKSGILNEINSILDINKTALALSGIKKQSIIGKKFSDIKKIA